MDDFSPVAVEQRSDSLTVFFSTAPDRDRARQAISARFPTSHALPRDVDDEDWARRSQQNLQPITVGRLTVFPTPLESLNVHPSLKCARPEGRAYLVIEPSMGFGTGHHATTRLCLAALQAIDLGGAVVLDVGTGSGVLALAARRLGARSATGIDTDADAVRSARENLRLNPDLDDVEFALADLNVWLTSTNSRQPVDLLTANLTGALLVRSAHLLVDGVRPGGHLILSGLMRSEQADVRTAFGGQTREVSATSEDEWVCVVLLRALA